MKFYLLFKNSSTVIEVTTDEYNTEAQFEDFSEIGAISKIVVDPKEGCVYGYVDE